MATQDRRGAFVQDVAIKAPCAAATTANITLAGVQTIDGISVGNNSERVLVQDQTDATQNGIYVAATGNWTRATDASKNTDFLYGTMVLVDAGTVNAGQVFMQTCTDSTITLGTSLIGFRTVALVAAAQQSGTSTTSVAIATGSKSFTTQANRNWSVNQWLLIQEIANANNQMFGQITAYTGTSLTVSVIATGGSGTHADWTIVLTNSPAAAGMQPPVGAGNVSGPGSSTASHLAVFADTTGKVLSDGGVAGALANLSTVAAAVLASSAVVVGMINGTLVESHSSNNVTYALKTLAGADPSAGDPVLFIIRNATGSYAMRTQTAALNVTITSGGTVGAVNSTPFRVWLNAFDNGGTMVLAAINCSTSSQIFPLADWTTASSTPDNGSGGSTSAGVFYTPNATTISSKNFCILGFFDYDSGLATAGTWNASPTRIVLFGPGVKRPGDVVQTARSASGAATSGTTAIPSDNTIPQSGEGDQYFSQAITPSSKQNRLAVHATLLGGSSTTAGNPSAVALFQDAGANALAVAAASQGVNNTGVILTLNYIQIANTIISTTFKIRAGQSGATTFYLNGNAVNESSGGAYNGTYNSFLEVSELMG